MDQGDFSGTDQDEFQRMDQEVEEMKEQQMAWEETKNQEQARKKRLQV